METQYDFDDIVNRRNTIVADGIPWIKNMGQEI